MSGKCGYGCVFLPSDGPAVTASGRCRDPDGICNFAGEIGGTVRAVKYALKHGFSEVEIRHDFIGVHYWAEQAGQSKKASLHKYLDFISRSQEKIKIRFVKVKAHSGDILNDEADRLAREAIGK